MRISRFLTAAGLALAIAITMSVSSLAQAKTDEDYDKLMKAVGAANGAIRGAAKEQNVAGISAEATKMVALFKEAEGVLEEPQQHRGGRMVSHGGQARRRPLEGHGCTRRSWGR